MLTYTEESMCPYFAAVHAFSSSFILTGLFYVNFYLGQMNVNRSIILYLNSSERSEGESGCGWFSGRMDG